MSKTTLILCGALVSLLPFAPSQERREGKGLQKVEKREGHTLKRVSRKVSVRKVKRLVRALGSEDEEVREGAMENLEGMGRPVLPLLRSMAEKEKSPEVRWRLKKVIRAIQGKGPRVIPKEEPPVVSPKETEDFLEEMQERLRNMMEEMEKEFTPFFGPGQSGIPKLRIPRIVPGGKTKVFSRNESVQIRIGPDGVVMEVRRKGADGKEEVKRYKAKSVEEFKKLYPDIAGKYNIGGNGFSFHFGTPPTMDFSRRLQKILERFGLTPGGPRPFTQAPPSTPGWRWWVPGPGRARPVKPLPAPVPSGDRLGVYVEDVPEPLARYLSLPPGFGLLVREVLPGSLAERAGIQPKDIVIEVQGRKITRAEDVRDALAEVPAGGRVKITVIRKGRKTVLQAVKGGSRIKVKKLKKVKV